MTIRSFALLSSAALALAFLTSPRAEPDHNIQISELSDKGLDAALQDLKNFDADRDGVLEYVSEQQLAEKIISCTGANYADYVDAQIKAQHSTTPVRRVEKSDIEKFRAEYARPFVVTDEVEDSLVEQAFAHAQKAQKNEKPGAYDSTGRDAFMISNAGTIYMSDQGLTFDEIEAKRKLMKQGLTEQQAQEQVRKMQPTFNPVAPTWTPTE